MATGSPKLELITLAIGSGLRLEAQPNRRENKSILTHDRKYPVNDAVCVKNIGAYSSASAIANFNGFPPAKNVLV
ncbi:MAG: hypothetical protein HYV04_14375 [Deltaproteobacteria bacterium]|nr:hypothetical protein [Deltaproteobacteria bacterium]